MGRTGALLVLILIAALLIPVVTATQDEEDEFKVPKEWHGMKKVKISHGDLAQVVFIKYITDIGDPDRDGFEDGYQLMEPVLWWDLGRYPSGVPYTINPSTAVKRYRLKQTNVVSEVKNSVEAWDNAVIIALYSDSPTINSKARVSSNFPDYKNVVTWGSISDPGIIAVSIIWYYSTTGQIVDADIMMNTAFRWGIDQDGEGTGYSLTNAFDIRNIMTHETGHWCGLDDIYDGTYSAMTMYGYGSLGEVKKISLEPGDVAGVQQVYPTP